MRFLTSTVFLLLCLTLCNAGFTRCRKHGKNGRPRHQISSTESSQLETGFVADDVKPSPSFRKRRDTNDFSRLELIFRKRRDATTEEETSTPSSDSQFDAFGGMENIFPPKKPTLPKRSDFLRRRRDATTEEETSTDSNNSQSDLFGGIEKTFPSQIPSFPTGNGLFGKKSDATTEEESGSLPKKSGFFRKRRDATTMFDEQRKAVAQLDKTRRPLERKQRSAEYEEYLIMYDEMEKDEQKKLKQQQKDLAKRPQLPNKGQKNN